MNTYGDTCGNSLSPMRPSFSFFVQALQYLPSHVVSVGDTVHCTASHDTYSISFSLDSCRLPSTGMFSMMPSSNTMCKNTMVTLAPIPAF